MYSGLKAAATAATLPAALPLLFSELIPADSRTACWMLARGPEPAVSIEDGHLVFESYLIVLGTETEWHQARGRACAVTQLCPTAQKELALLNMSCTSSQSNRVIVVVAAGSSGSGSGSRGRISN